MVAAYQPESKLPIETYESIAQLRTELGRPFTPDDVTYGQFRGELIEAAEKFVKTYTGTFDFVRDVKASYTVKEYLSPGQSKGILNCIAAEWRRRPQPKPESEPEEPVDPNRWIIPDGTYTVVNEDGSYHTLRLKTLDAEKQVRYNKPKGTRIISYLNGPDNSTNYMMFGWVMPNGALRLKDTFHQNTALAMDATNLLSMSINGVLKTTTAYALKSNHCSACGMPLTVEKSIKFGMGPICRRKFGVD